MKTHTSKHTLGDSVTVTIDSKKLRWCIITAVKFEYEKIKYDVRVNSSDLKLYDLDSSVIEGIEEEATKIAKEELS